MRYKQQFFVGLGCTLFGMVGGHYLLPRATEEKFKVADVNGDGNLDLIVDNNWGIILTTDKGYITPVDTIDPSYKVCFFSPETQLPNDNSPDSFREKAHPLLQYCLSH